MITKLLHDDQEEFLSDELECALLAAGVIFTAEATPFRMLYHICPGKSWADVDTVRSELTRLALIRNRSAA